MTNEGLKNDRLGRRLGSGSEGAALDTMVSSR
jgi:hypothetical protein